MLDTKNLLFIGFSLAAVSACLAYIGIEFQYKALHSENSLLENAQVLFLAVAAVGYLLVAPSRQNERLVNVAIALLCFSFILRELDIEHLNLGSLFVALGTGTGRKILLAVLWLSLAAYGFRTVTKKRLFFKQFISSRAFIALTAAFLLLTVGAVIDRQILQISHGVLFEELAETNAYFCIALPVLAKAISRASKTGSNFFAEFLAARPAPNQSDT
jgi:hypothetical protein